MHLSATGRGCRLGRNWVCDEMVFVGAGLGVAAADSVGSAGAGLGMAAAGIVACVGIGWRAAAVDCAAPGAVWGLGGCGGAALALAGLAPGDGAPTH